MRHATHALLRALFSLAAMLSLVVLPAATVGEAAGAGCADIQIAIDYIDPVSAQLITVNGDSSTHFPIPISVPLTIKIFPSAEFAGKAVIFNSPNQYLVLDTSSISDGGVAGFQVAQAIPNVNFYINWATGDTDNDGQLSFQATIDPSNIANGKSTGSLMTIGAHVAGGRCGAHIEIFGVPGGGGPGPGPCPGIAVLIEFEDSMGNFKPAMPVVQSPTNTQYSGPGVGFKVRYTVQSSNAVIFTPALKLIASFNRQTILSAVGAPNTINNLIAPKKVFFNTNTATWNGVQLVITTQADSVGLDTVRFDSLNANGTINSLCSTHREVRIAATPGD